MVQPTPVGIGLRILILLAALVILCLGMVWTCEGDPYTVSDHPRLFLRNASGDAGWLDTLATRAYDTHWQWYLRSKNKVDSAPSGVYWWRVQTDAFVGMIEATANADSSYLNHAIDVLMYLHTNEPSRFTNPDQSDMEIAETPQVLLAYDWLYPFMSQAQRDAVGQTIGADVDARAAGTSFNIITDWAYPYLPAGGFHLVEALIVYADSTAGGAAYSDSVATYFWNVRDRFTYDDLIYDNTAGFLSCADQGTPYGTQYGYFIKRFANLFAIPEALRSSGDTVDYAATSSFLANMATYQRFYFPSDNSMPKNVGKVNQSVVYCQAYPIYCWAGDQLGDQAAQCLANRILERTDDGDDCLKHDDNREWRTLVWYKPWLPEDCSPDSTSFYDEQNLVSVRDRWSWDDLQTATDTSTVIQTDWYMPVCQSGVVASGHTTLQRGSDRLLWSSGQRSSDVDLQFYPFYIQSFGWNAPLVYKSGEDMGTVSGISCDGTIDVAEIGGQSPSVYKSSNYHSCNDSVKAYLTYCGSEPMWKQWGGKFVAFADMGRVVYARGNLTAAYTYDCNETKASNAIREWIFVRPSDDDASYRAILVVRDWITRLDPTYTTSAQWHVLHQPTVDDASGIVADEGEAWASVGGGVYDMGTLREMTITRNDSEAQVHILKPASNEGKVYVTGGPSPAGVAWVQDWQSGCAHYNAAATSYEFYVDGKNYPPAHAASGRFDTHGNEACDWTIRAQAPSTGTEVEILAAFVVDAAGSSPSTAEWTEGTENNLRIVVDTDTVNVVFTPSGWFKEVVLGERPETPPHEPAAGTPFVRSIEAARDTYLRQEAQYHDDPQGFSTIINFAATDTSDMVPIVVFEIPELYSGESFDSARIVVKAAGSPLQSSECRLYWLLSNAWDEATATWPYRIGAVPWDSAGAWGGNDIDIVTDYGYGANGILYEFENPIAPPSPDSFTVARGTGFSDFIEGSLGSQVSFIWHDIPDSNGGNWSALSTESEAGFGPTLRIYGQKPVPDPTTSSRRRRMMTYPE